MVCARLHYSQLYIKQYIRPPCLLQAVACLRIPASSRSGKIGKRSCSFLHEKHEPQPSPPAASFSCLGLLYARCKTRQEPPGRCGLVLIIVFRSTAGIIIALIKAQRSRSKRQQKGTKLSRSKASTVKSVVALQASENRRESAAKKSSHRVRSFTTSSGASKVLDSRVCEAKHLQSRRLRSSFLLFEEGELVREFQISSSICSWVGLPLYCERSASLTCDGTPLKPTSSLLSHQK